MFDVRLLIDQGTLPRSVCAHRTSTIQHPTSSMRRGNIRHGMSLLEVLLSMFVLLFGLMGVVALFPVGNHYAKQGDKFERGTTLAQNAFDELTSRGILQPEFWLYANNSAFIQPSGTGIFNNTSASGPGHAFVIDPLGAAKVNELRFPFGALAAPLNGNNPWFGAPSNLAGNVWPVRRITLSQAGSVPLTTAVAETIFSLRDDITVERPEEDDRPSIQRWKTDTNGTLEDFSDDLPLRRAYHGNFSWLATVVPTSNEALAGLQPADPGYQSYYYDVSVVVFYKRDDMPSVLSERLIEAQLFPGGELEMFSTDSAFAVDAAVEDIRGGDWIAITGVNQVTGDFMMRWYRLLSLDEETRPRTGGDAGFARRAALVGPEWPAHSITNLRAVLLPGAIGVVTQQMKVRE